jgi:hypothetical protein
MMRWYNYLAASVIFCLLNFASAPSSRLDAPGLLARTRPPANTSAPLDVPAAPLELTPVVYLPAFHHPGNMNPFGVIMYGGVTDEQGLAKMTDAGSRWVTTRLVWATAEPYPPVGTVHTYHWSAFDTAAQNAQAAGVNLFVLVTGNPAWAASSPGGPVTDMASMVSFVTAVAERYDGDGNADAAGQPVVNYWSFYAEPDNNQEWRATQQGKGLWGDNPAGYAAMLSQVAPAMHAANPRAKVLIGGLAYDWFTTDCNPKCGPYVKSFLGGVLQNLNNYPGGATRYLDAVAFHYYPISTWRWPTIRNKALEIQNTLNQHGAGSLPLIVPEMGYWSDPAAGSSETLQAQGLVQMYVRGFSAGIRQMSWYQVFDFGGGTESTGLFRNGNLLDPRPAYLAYNTMTAELTHYRYAQTLAAAGVEGYVFSLENGQTKTVLWATGSARNVPFNQECARRVDLLGAATQVTDGGAGDLDGANNGQVTLSIGSNNPTYVGACL